MEKLKSQRQPVNFEDQPTIKVEHEDNLQNFVPNHKSHAPFSMLKVERNSKYWRDPSRYSEKTITPGPDKIMIKSKFLNEQNQCKSVFKSKVENS